MRKIAFTGALMLAFCQVWTQSHWMRFYGNNNSDFGVSAVRTADGGYIQGISTSFNPPQNSRVNAGIIKTDKNGNQVWIKELIADTSFIITEALPFQGGFVVAGNIGKAYNGEIRPMLVKLDAVGNIVWSKEYNIAGRELLEDISVTADGHLLVSGQTGFNFDPNLWVFKVDGSGNLVWSQVWDAPFGVTGSQAEEAPSGKIVIAATHSSFTFTQTLLTMLHPDGSFYKTFTYGVYYDDEVEDMFINGADEIFLCGQSYFINRNWDGYLWKIDSSGTLTWAYFYDAGTAYGEVVRAIEQDGGRIAMAGDIGGFDERDIFLSLVNTDGSMEFTRKYPISQQFTNYIYDLEVVPGDGYVLTGDIRPVNMPRDGMLMKTTKDGFVGCFYDNTSFQLHQEIMDTASLTLVNLQPTVNVQNITVQQVSPDVTAKTFCEYIPPVAGFDTTGTEMNCPLVCIEFKDTSLEEPFEWHWTFESGNPDTSNEKNPQICFPGSGTYEIRLIVTNNFDSDTIVKEIQLESGCEPVIPNVFTPNGDNTNDMFLVGSLPEFFRLGVFNRWGIEIFTTSDKDQMWDGNSGPFDLPAPEGVYYYVFEDQSNQKTYSGHFTLVR